MNKQQEPLDVFDHLFSQLADDQSTISDFSDAVKNSMDESARKKGYDSFSEMISAEISNSLSNRQPQKPKVDTKKVSADHISRYEYMMQAIQSVTYEPKYQGYYGEGHRSCLESYAKQMENNAKDLCVIEEKVKADIKVYARLLKKNRNDAYTQGHYDALVLLANSLLRSKKAKMREIKQVVLDMKEKAQ